MNLAADPLDELLQRYGYTKEFTWDIKAGTMGKRKPFTAKDPGSPKLKPCSPR